ncbi:MAG TPA: hypothetical protein PK539_03220 [Candidatus Paceibacterota bacterium]|nr:hypothetical protein [Candidatus Paceibacterota bacterium]
MKTGTAFANKGNMPLEEDGITPAEKWPKCIVMNWWLALWGVMLNAVGLSNIGIKALAAKGLWQKLTQPFMISVMAIGGTPEARLEEMRILAKDLAELLAQCCVFVAIQLNVSCPNIAHTVARDQFVKETLAFLDILAVLGVHIFVKINVLASVEDMKVIAAHPACAGIIVSNTLPWTHVPKWMHVLFFGSTTSPLEHLGGGGLSGWPLRRRVNKWIRAARKAGITTHINAGGGIFGPLGAFLAWLAGADSISLGTIALVRPWMLGPTIWFGNWLFGNFPRRLSWQ